MTDLKLQDTVYVTGEFDRKERKNVYRKFTIGSESQKDYFLVNSNGYTVGVINKRSGRVKFERSRSTVPFYTSPEVWEREWVNKNEWKLSDAIKGVRDYKKLRQIAEIAGFAAELPEYIIK